jgi:ATP/maltotriose-dependent transcriptional regulator MalT
MRPPLSESPFRVVSREPSAIPLASPGHVTRPHLLRRLLCAESRLTLTFAPAGFGKSALHGECARLAPVGTQVIWLELLGHAITPGELLARIAAEMGFEVESGDPRVSLGRLLGRMRHPLWLMLDDYPRQLCPELDACLEDLIERTPHYVQWWISGRRRPKWSLPRLVLQDGLQELDASDLAFDAAVLQRLLCERRMSLPDALRMRLLEECEGWPALICLLLREVTVETLPQHLETGAPLLLNYLQREVQPEPVQQGAQLLALRSRHPQWFSAEPVSRPAYVAEPRPSLSSLLSKRELSILQLIAAGLSNREIAGQLCLSVNTVKAHAWNINGKLGTERRTQAVAQAKLQGLLG